MPEQPGRHQVDWFDEMGRHACGNRQGHGVRRDQLAVGHRHRVTRRETVRQDVGAVRLQVTTTVAGMRGSLGSARSPRASRVYAGLAALQVGVIADKASVSNRISSTNPDAARATLTVTA